MTTLRSRHAMPFVLGTIFIDAIGFGIIMPVLPRLLMEVGRFDLPHAIRLGTGIGLLMAAATFLASPVLGNLSDAWGRRRVLLLALGGLAVDYALLALAHTIPLLLLARAVSGVFGGSFAPAQAALADITPPEARARTFGYVGAAFGIGFIAGPAIGGLIGELGPRVPFWVAAGLATANFVYGLTLFPETLPPERRRAFSWRRANPLGAWAATGGAPGVRRLVVVLLLWQVASLVYPLVWSFWAIAALGWSSAAIGASFAAVGLVIALSQAFVTGPAVKRLGERRAAMFGLLSATTGFVLYALVTRTWQAYAVMPAIALQGMIYPSILAMMSARMGGGAQGETQGVASMTLGLGSLAAPLLLTGTMARFTGPGAPVQFPGAPFVVAAAFGIAALAALRTLPAPKPPGV